jgi:hypothetical protein
MCKGGNDDGDDTQSLHQNHRLDDETQEQEEEGDNDRVNNNSAPQRPPCPLLLPLPIDDDKKRNNHPSAVVEVFFLCIWRFLTNTILFGWAFPLLRLGMERPIEESDLPELHPTDTSEFNRSKVERLLLLPDDSSGGHCRRHRHPTHRPQPQNTTASTSITSKDDRLGLAIFRDYVQSTWLAQVLLAINMTSRIVQALALGFLMEHLTTTTTTTTNNTTDGYMWAGIMVGCGLIAFPTKQRLYFETYRKG